MKQYYPGKWLFLFVALTFATSLRSQTFKLLKDINAQTNSIPSNATNNSTSYAVLNGKVYFAADDGVHGNELWCSDGTTAGTKLVKDINPGQGGSMVRYIYTFKNKIYFFSSTNYQSSRLYVSDGTEAGTIILKDNMGFTGYEYDANSSFVEMNGKLYFAASNSGNFEELWVTDGTKEGTSLVANFNTSPYGYTSGIANLMQYHGKLYFSTGYFFGASLWYSNGTATGTQKFTNTQNDFSQDNSQLVYNDTLYILNGWRVFQSTGNPSGTKSATSYLYTITDIAAGKNNLFCFVSTGINRAQGLYKYDPSNQYGASVIRNFERVQRLTTSQDIKDSLYYFLAKDTADTNTGLWVTDGTTKNTIKLLDNVSASSDPAQPSNFFILNKKLYFSHTSNNNGDELWVTDGTVAGTKMATDINPGIYNSSPSNFTQLDNDLLFTANSNSNGVELWKLGGINTNATLVKDINNTTTSLSYTDFSYRSFYDSINNRLIFWATDGIHGRELWATDGTGNGTTLLKDILPGSGSGDGTTFYKDLNYTLGLTTGISKLKNDYYFYAISPANNFALWKTQGTPGSTALVSSVFPPTSFLPTRTGATGNYFFTVTGIGNNSKLYAYNGSGDPVVIKQDFFSPYVSADGYFLPDLNDNIYFFDNNYINDNPSLDLWKSDGTVAGTTLVKNLYLPIANYPPHLGKHITYKQQLFFIANSGGSSAASPSPDYDGNTAYLWKTDGTAAGTNMISKAKVADPYFLVISNNKLYFTVSDSATGQELWVTDGTLAGTHIVKDINPGNGSSIPSNGIDVNGTLYFIASDGTGYGIWKSDGTANGTSFVAKGGAPYVTAANKLYFVHENKIWRSDGTAAGTYAMDTTGLEGVSNIDNLIYAFGKLYFTGSSYTYGNEIYTTTKSILPVTLLNFKGSLQSNNTLLQWATVNEQNNDYFAVQRSTNGVSFVTIGRVNAKQGIKENDYDFTDPNINNLGVTKVYYRLQQFDLDGKSTFSNTIALDVDNSNLLRVGPNPAVGYTNLYSSINIANALITLTDINGHVLYTTKQSITAGSKTNIPLAGYAAGVYTVTVQSTGIKKQEFKVVAGK